MLRFLIFLSSFLLFFNSHIKAEISDSPSKDGELQRFVFELSTKKTNLTGIMIIYKDDDLIKGSLINEFGFSVLEFIYSNDKKRIQLQNIVGFLNKWYIKSQVKKDLKTCIEYIYNLPTKSYKNYEIIDKPESIEINNKKHNLRYCFTRLNNINDETGE